MNEPFCLKFLILLPYDETVQRSSVLIEFDVHVVSEMGRNGTLKSLYLLKKNSRVFLPRDRRKD